MQTTTITADDNLISRIRVKHIYRNRGPRIFRFILDVEVTTNTFYSAMSGLINIHLRLSDDHAHIQNHQKYIVDLFR